MAMADQVFSFSQPQYGVSTGATSVSLNITLQSPGTGSVAYTADFFDGGTFDASPDDWSWNQDFLDVSLVNEDDNNFAHCTFADVTNPDWYAPFRKLFDIDPSIHDDLILTFRARSNCIDGQPYVYFTAGNAFYDTYIDTAGTWETYTFNIPYSEWATGGPMMMSLLMDDSMRDADEEPWPIDARLTFTWDYTPSDPADYLDIDDIRLWFGDVSPPPALQSAGTPVTVSFNDIDHVVSEVALESELESGSGFYVQLVKPSGYDLGTPYIARISGPEFAFASPSYEAVPGANASIGITLWAVGSGSVGYTADFMDGGSFDDGIEDWWANDEYVSMDVMSEDDNNYARLAATDNTDPYGWYTCEKIIDIDSAIHEDMTLTLRARSICSSDPATIWVYATNEYYEVPISNTGTWDTYTVNIPYYIWEGWSDHAQVYLDVGWGSAPASLDNYVEIDDIHMWFGDVNPPAALQSASTPVYAIFDETEEATSEFKLDPGMPSGSYFDIRLVQPSGYIIGTPGIAMVTIATPVANFTANATIGGIPMTVQFTDLSTGAITQWAWDFNGDGINDSTEQNPVYTYSEPGIYTVTLVASNAFGGSTVIKTDYITVRNIYADFSADRVWGGVPCHVRFTDASQWSPTSWAWDFNGDGINDSTEQNPVYTYEVPGTYDVTLYVSNADGDMDVMTKTEYITINPPGQVAFHADNDWVNYDAPKYWTELYDDTPGDTDAWYWDVNNDGFIDYTSQNVIDHDRFFYDTGDWSVSLTIHNSSGYYTLVKENYIHCRHRPIARFSAEYQSYIIIPGNNATVQFHDQSPNDTIYGPVIAWDWDFGDGSHSYEQNPVHNYTQFGDFTVKLKINSMVDFGTDMKRGYIHVGTLPPTASFTANVTSGYSPLTVQFMDTSSELIGAPNDAWAWDFNGDGINDSTAKNPVYTFVTDAPTQYTIKHYVHNSAGWGMSSIANYIMAGHIYNEYAYSKDLIIGGVPECNLTGYIMEYSIHPGIGTDNGPDIYLNGLSRSWPNDIRFSNSDGQLLSYNISSVNAESAIIRVKVDYIAASPGNTRIVLHYGRLDDLGASEQLEADGILEDFSNDSRRATAWKESAGSSVSQTMTDVHRFENNGYHIIQYQPRSGWPDDRDVTLKWNETMKNTMIYSVTLEVVSETGGRNPPWITTNVGLGSSTVGWGHWEDGGGHSGFTYDTLPGHTYQIIWTDRWSENNVRLYENNTLLDSLNVTFGNSHQPTLNIHIGHDATGEWYFRNFRTVLSFDQPTYGGSSGNATGSTRNLAISNEDISFEKVV